jgi:predicted nucleotidyltransferase
MFSREHILNLLGKAKTDLGRRYHVRSMALFGSYSRNEQTEKSDVDLLVDFDDGMTFSKLIRFSDNLEKRLGLPVDVIPADGIKPHYRDFIQKDLVYV